MSPRRKDFCFQPGGRAVVVESFVHGEVGTVLQVVSVDMTTEHVNARVSDYPYEFRVHVSFIAPLEASDT